MDELALHRIGSAAIVCTVRALSLTASIVFVAAAPLRAQGQVGVVLVQVTDATTRATLPGVSVAIPDLGLSQSTDDAGRVRLTQVPVGTHRVLARRIGYDTATVSVSVPAMNDSVETQILLRAIPQRLDSVVVNKPAAGQEIAEFEERRKHNVGQFITSAQIDSMPGSSLDAIFAKHIRGFRVVNDRANGTHITSLRPPAERATRGRPRAICPPLVFLDGVALTTDDDSGPDVSILRGGALAAVEVYAPSEIPVRYRTYGEMSREGRIVTGASCGAVLLWTRR